MRLLLCSEIKQAEELFRVSRNLGPELNVGYSFVQLVRAVMTFDDDAMEKAMKSLEATKAFCTSHQKKFSFFSSSSAGVDKLSPHERVYRRCIVADCLLFEAMLVFLKQGITSYVKGGYLLRKAWKTYEKVYSEMERLCSCQSPISKVGTLSPTDRHVGTSVYDKTAKGVEATNEDDEEISASGLEDEMLSDGFASLGVTEDNDSCPIDLSEKGGSERGEEDSPTSSQSANGSTELSTEGKDAPDGRAVPGKNGKRPASGFFVPDIPTSMIQSLEHADNRLRGAVYFGYGLMNIILSLIPPKLMKLANLFGFTGNRRVGLEALEFSSNSQDMKAPLARMALLWYHTIIRPFFALDGEEEDAGAAEAARLLEQAQTHYVNSPLFLYFQGKILYLRSQLTEALQVYTSAAALAREQREVEHIILYEKGWVHFLQLEYGEALPCYIRLKNETRWSACYYAYLAAVLSGVTGDLKQSRELFLQTTKLVKRKNNNLEKFCSRRGGWFKKGETPLMLLETQLMAVEIIYLWRALPFCSVATKQQLLDTLSIALPPGAQPIHAALKAWLKGVVLNSLDQTAEAETCLRESLRYEEALKYEKHIFSFAIYEMAMINIGKREYARARRMLDLAVGEYSGYEFEARLNFKVHSARSQLPG